MKVVSTWSRDGHINTNGYSEGAGDGQAAAAQHRREARIVEETLVEGASVARVARAHGVNANQVFYWRKLYQAGRLGASTGAQLLPVRVTAESTLAKISRKQASPTPIGCSPTLSPGTIHIELGQAQVRIEGGLCDDEIYVT
jgi:transposase